MAVAVYTAAAHRSTVDALRAALSPAADVVDFMGLSPWLELS